jgi:hypothetical protein
MSITALNLQLLKWYKAKCNGCDCTSMVDAVMTDQCGGFYG